MGPATIAFQAASWQCSSLDLDIIHRKVCGGTANLSLSYFHHVAKFQILLIWTLLYSDKNIYPHTHAEYSKSHATQLLHALYTACTTLMNSWANCNAASDWRHRKVGGDLPKNNKKVKTRRCKSPRPWWDLNQRNRAPASVRSLQACTDFAVHNRNVGCVWPRNTNGLGTKTIDLH